MINYQDKPQRRVLLMIRKNSHKLECGVARHVKEAGWQLRRSQHPTPIKWEGHGIIAISHPGDEGRDFLSGQSIPVVLRDELHPELQIPRVLLDQHRIGTLAAEHLLEKGFKRFIYVSSSGGTTKDLISDAFRQRLHDNQRDCAHFRYRRYEHESFDDRQRRLKDFLANQLGPLAVFCTSDDMAVDVMAVCREADFRIPDDVAILSLGNDEIVCENAAVEISSIDPNLEAQGYRAAVLLDHLINGEPVPIEPELIPPLGVVARTSTDIMMVSDTLVEQALTCIRSHYMDGIGVEDVAEALKTTRHVLTKRFSIHLGRTPGEELRRARIQAAEQKLLSTSDTLEAIAQQIGYRSANSLCLAFKRETGSTPHAFRRQRRSTHC